MKPLDLGIVVRPVVVSAKTKNELLRKIQGSRVHVIGFANNISYSGYVANNIGRQVLASDVRVYVCKKENGGWVGCYYDVPLNNTIIKSIKQNSRDFTIVRSN